MESMRDEELKAKLAAHGINAAITASTRGLYLRKLARLEKEESGSSDSTPSSVSLTTDPVSLSTDPVSSSTDPVSTSSSADPVSSTTDPVSSTTDLESSTAESMTDPVSSTTDPVSSTTDLESKIAPYFAVATSTSTPEETRSALSPFYLDQKDLIKALKGCVGARFKKVSNEEEAKEFSQNIFPEELGPKYSLERALSPLPGVKKARDKNQLGSLIKEGKVDEFLETVWSNPRYLIGSGDTPEIIHPGTRRNALHLAAQHHQLDICQHIMDIVRSDRFWNEVYPVNDILLDSAMSSSERRSIEGMDIETVRERKREVALRVREESKAHLVDLYLNIQDGNERAKVKVSEKHYTPLHIAAMYGFEDIVEFLMSFAATDTTKRDNQGRTAADIACVKCSTGNEQLKSRIRDLINNPSIYYVPVIRSADNSSPASLGSPCIRDNPSSFQTQEDQLSNPGITTSPLVSQALAGPLSPAKANALLKEWKSPSSLELKKKASFMKRSDPDRGLERVGRILAHRDSIGWMEYWDFLGSYADLSKPDGLRKLDRYLFTLSVAPATPAAVKSASSRTLSRLSLLANKEDSPKVRLFTEEGEDKGKVGVVSNGSGTTNITNEVEDPLPLVSSVEPHPPSESLEEGLERMTLSEETLPEPVTIEYSCKTPSRIDKSNAVYIAGGGAPSKLDRDVLCALCGVDVDVREFPHVYQWKRLIESFKEQERKQWSTPRSQGKYSLRRTDESSLAPSPLVYYSPPPPSPLLTNSPSSVSRGTPIVYRSTPQHLRQTPTRLLTPTRLGNLYL